MALSLQPITSPSLLSIRAARLDDVRPVLALHQEAFADKFGGAFGAQG
ncbi:MAG: N-acetyltransferase, partial [Chloroflexales bacterium]|nr:N-acetyltransferase [Chloroflexales bacterium]